MMIYDFTLFAMGVTNCDEVVSVEVWNNFIWFADRSLVNFVWVIPIIYVFWPKLKKKSRLINHN